MKRFLAIRVSAFLAFFLGSLIAHRNVGAILARWDARWYSRIAENGYGNIVHASGGRTLHDYAFFPLFPALERAVHLITRVSYPISGLVISLLASLVGLVAIERIGMEFYPRYSKQLIIVWALAPTAAVLWLSYSESLFTACSAWALYFALKERWALAGIAALLAGATRPLGVALAIALIVQAIIRAREAHSYRPYLFVLLTPMGTFLYLLYVDLHSRSNDILAYLHFQAGWGNGFDGGHALFAFAISGSPSGFLVLAIIAIFLLLTVAMVRMELPSVLKIYGLAVVFMTLTTAGYFSSNPRYLLPAFILFAPIAQAISTLNPRVQRVLFWIALPLSCIASTLFLLGSTAP